MDAKTEYSVSVGVAKGNANDDAKLMKKILDGAKRKDQFSENWASVNINDVINNLAPNSTPYQNGSKIYFDSIEGKYSIICDIGGGHLRIYDNFAKDYVGLNGENLHNYKDEHGKQHGRTPSDFKAVTHFRIMTREEMQK